MEGRDRTVGGVVLGAGRSSRFGDANKLLTPIDGVPMVARVADVALESCLDNTVVVLGYDAGSVAGALNDRHVSTVHNANYTAGQSSSVKCGIGFGADAGWDAVAVLLGDMPFVDPETVDRLVAAYRTGAGPIVAPRHDGRRGNPVIFDQSQFDRLHTLSGDRGARDLVEAHPDTTLLATDDPGVRRDIDTMSDNPGRPG